jgi:hypothetical protein
MPAAVRSLREKLGHDGMSDLEVWSEERKDEVLSIAAERFERRLSHELGAVRIDLAKEFAASRVELANLRAEVAAQSAATRADVLKWSFLFWLGQVGAVTGAMAFLLRITRS